MKAARDTFVNPLLALVVCALAGTACAWLRMPLPWMIGPLLAMAACNFGGAQLRAPPGSRPVGQIIIGTALGLYFTPQVARELIGLWPVLVAAAVLALVIGISCGWLLSRLSGIDRATAFFASIPGGATEMAVLAERFGARVDHVALAQSLRVLVVVIVIPFALTYSGVHGTDGYIPADTIFDGGRLAMLLAVATGAGGLFALARVGSAFMFGPLLATALLTGFDVRFSSMPGTLSNLAQLLLGCALGTRFERKSLATLPAYSAAAIGSIFAAIGLSTLAAYLLALAGGLNFASLVLAAAPGGIAEMCITAKVLQLGVPMVTAAHVVRVVVLVSSTGLVYRAALALDRRINR